MVGKETETTGCSSADCGIVMGSMVYYQDRHRCGCGAYITTLSFTDWSDETGRDVALGPFVGWCVGCGQQYSKKELSVMPTTSVSSDVPWGYGDGPKEAENDDTGRSDSCNLRPVAGSE